MANGFRGGVHPNDCKGYSAKKSIETAPLPQKVIIPTRQHIGAPCSPLVTIGEIVKKGQIIAEAQAFVSSPVHATISGKIVDINNYPHPVFGRCQAIVIESDGKDEWVEGTPREREWQHLANEEIINILRENGIVGMGGATFPTHVKMSPPPEKKIDSLLLNGVECEPYLTADYRLMLEFPDKIIRGLQIAAKVLAVENVYVGIEANKPDAIEIMRKHGQATGIQVVSLKTKYPQGAEKALIKAILNREVPSGGLPMDVGAVVQNAGTIVAIANAVERGIPLIERVVSVTGGAITEPKNLLLRLGTSFAEAVAYCGGLKRPAVKLIMGGPMMGNAQVDMNVPIIKGTSGILALTPEDVQDGPESPCIRCGRCIKACPMGLNPSMLSILGERGKFIVAKEDYALLDCVECGSCVFTCPAKRNIVQYIKLSKTQNAALTKK